MPQASVFQVFVPTLPFNILACNYDEGGEGEGFHQTTQGDGTGTSYRRDGGKNLKPNSDAQTKSDWVIGWGSAGTWYDYTVDVDQPGDYAIALRCETLTGSTFHIEVDGRALAKVNVPATGPWDTAASWKSINVPGTVTLAAGDHVIRAVIEASWLDLAGINVTQAGAGPGPGPGPGPSPTPPATYPGNREVNVPAGADLGAVFRNNGANTTFKLAAGVYNVNNGGNNPLITVRANQQVIGQNPDMNTDQTIIRVTGWSGGWGVFDDTAGGDSGGFQMWGVTMDMGGGASGFGRATQLFKGGAKVQITNCHFINIVSSVKGQERFILHNDASNIIDGCRFSYATSGGTDGHTTITQGEVKNCHFDKVTAGAGTYFHCIGQPCQVTNCTWDGTDISGGGAFSEGCFIYGEPGNGISPNQLSGTYTFKQNKVNLGGGQVAFLGFQCHSSFPGNAIPGTFVIDDNDISNGIVLRIFGNINNPIINGTVKIQHNRLSGTTMTELNGGQVNTLITSPNP